MFRDLGLILTGFGVLVSLFFGLTASTRTAVDNLGGDVGALRDDVRTIGVLLERMEPAFPRMDATLERIERVLLERLPGRS